jgi:hypothetical protein
MSKALQRFPDLPTKMKHLPCDHRGFPVPYFVAWIDGLPEFPVADGSKLIRCIRKSLCWVCGGELGRVHAFLIGPMCAINRTSSEPPSHLECARFSARNCPFLTKPRMKRVDKENLPITDPGGIMIERNPGVSLLWAQKAGQWQNFDDGKGGILFDIGEKPHFTEWYAHGRRATRDEVMQSIITGLPQLEQMCLTDPDPSGAVWELEQRKGAAFKLVPA